MASKSPKYISTVVQIEKLKPRDERYEIADANLRKNRIVVFPSGAKSWIHRYRFGGRTRKLTLECGATDLARARELGAAAMNAVELGIDPGVAKQEKKLAGDPLTVDGMIVRYLDRHVYKRNEKVAKRARKQGPLRSAAEIERVLHKELAPFRNRRAADGVSSFDAKKLIDDVAERGAVMGNRTLAYCKALYNFATAEKIAASNPFEDLKLTEEEDRDRVLSADELGAVWNAAGTLGEPYTAIIRLLILTGQRLNEIACLRRSEIDLVEKRQITLPGSRTKNGRSHIVALSEPAIEILEAAKKVESEEELIFTITGRRISGWSKVRTRLAETVTETLGKEPEHWTLHDLRRTFATIANEDLKIAPHIVDKILNHSNGVVRGVAAVYNRAEWLDERRAALEAWARFVLATVERKGSANVVALRAGR
jgi:integrase